MDMNSLRMYVVCMDETTEDTCTESNVSKQDDLSVSSTYPYSMIDFPFWPKDQSQTVAKILNAYIQFNGNIKELTRNKVVSRTHLWQLLKDERFRALIRDIDISMVEQAEGVVVDIMHNSDNDANKLKAASLWLSAHNPGKWDSGVRREKARVASEIQGSLLQSKITSERAKEIIAKDPFIKITADVSGEGLHQQMTDKSRYQAIETEAEAIADKKPAPTEE